MISLISNKKIFRNNIKNISAKILFTLLITAAVFIVSSQSAHAMDFAASRFSPDTDTKVKLDWSSVPGAQTYEISRDSGTGAVNAADIDVDSVEDPLTYLDENLQPSTTYTYTIKAYSGDNVPVLLDEKTAVVLTTEMIRPYNLRAVFDINSKIALLSWNSSMLATGSIIYRTESGTTTSRSTAETAAGTDRILGSAPVQFSVQSTGSGTSAKSETVTVVPVEQPEISIANYYGNTVELLLSGNADISLFQLERSSWNGTSWGGWTSAGLSFLDNTYYSFVDAPGSYRFRLNAKGGSGYKGFSNITETAGILAAPSDLTPTIVNSGRIDISWTNPPLSTNKIQIWRKTGGNDTSGAYTLIATKESTETLHSDLLTLVPGTVYYYHINAVDLNGKKSISIGASVLAALPDAASQLKASITGASGITLAWADNSDNESGFKIERMSGNSGSFIEIAEAGPDDTTFTDATAVSGSPYIYRVCSFNALGNAAYTNEVAVNAWDAVAPASLTVTPVSSNRLDLSWSYSGTGSYNTIIERKTGIGGIWTPIYTSPLGMLKYSDTGLASNTRYFYRVRKSFGAGLSGIPYPNNEIGIGADTLLGNLTLHGEAVSGNYIHLSWSANDGDVIIERKMANGSFTALTTVSAALREWYDGTGLIPGASYTYRIKIKTPTNESLYSNECTVQNFYLDAPSDLEISVDSESHIVLKWVDNSTEETGFEIWRDSNEDDTYKLYATVNSNTTTFTDKGVGVGIQYYYKIRSYISEDSQYSPYSDTVTTGVGMISPPTDLTYDTISSTKIDLSWTDNSNNESGFSIEQKDGSDGEWETIGWVTKNDTSYTVYNLSPYNKYYFRIRAYTYGDDADSVSEEILVSTALPPYPSDVSAISISSSQVKISWKDNSDSEDGFKILRRYSFSSYFTTVGKADKNTTEFLDKQVNAGTKYYYKVASFNVRGSSESEEAEVTTNIRASFSDLGNVSWARDAIENLAGMGIINGVSQTRFNPGGTISKAEFTAIVVRAFKFGTAPVGSMADVKPNKWYYKEVMTAENLGIVSGDSKNKFYPDSAITREEIALMLFKAVEASQKELTVHDNSALEKFSDKNSISPHALSSMATLVGEGIIEGLSGNAVGPRNTATRAQAAVFLYRLLNKLNG